MTLEPLLNAPFAIQFHVATVLPAAVLGAFLLARPKGTPSHRLLGKIWLVLMVMTSLSTFFIHGINTVGGFSPIHLLSVYVIAGSVFASRDDAPFFDPSPLLPEIEVRLRFDTD